MGIFRRKGLFAVLLMLLFGSVVTAVASFYPVTGHGTQTRIVVDETFRISPLEIYRQGLGTYQGTENITVHLATSVGSSVKLSIITYDGFLYTNDSASQVDYTFKTKADYYEVVLNANATTNADIRLQVTVQKPAVEYPLSYLAEAAKLLFIFSSGAIMFLIIKPFFDKRSSAQTPRDAPKSVFQQKNLKWLKIGLIISLIVWLILLAGNTNPFATFESWYTDNGRGAYTSMLFMKDGFSVFGTPLTKLASADVSFFKFITWPQMPHLYPIGSIFLFLPIGALLEIAVAQAFVFKLEITFLLIISHLCMYLFLKAFWKDEFNLSLKELYLKPFWKQEIRFLQKVFAMYLFYITLVIYAANGQFDSVAILFCVPAFAMFLKEKDDAFLLFAAVATTFKYQAGIFLLPLVALSLIRLAKQPNPLSIFKSKALLLAIGLAAVDLFTMFLSVSYLADVSSEFTLNTVNAFNPQAQIPWGWQVFAVILTLVFTLSCAVYLLKTSRIISFFMVFSLIPFFILPYFQVWYLPYFFVYLLIPQTKRSMEVTLLWITIMVFVISFGAISYNPAAIVDHIRTVLGV
jgi:hypothetical protein